MDKSLSGLYIGYLITSFGQATGRGGDARRLTSRRREKVSVYGEECGNKISRKFTPGVFDHHQVNDGKSDFAKALRSNEFIV